MRFVPGLPILAVLAFLAPAALAQPSEQQRLEACIEKIDQNAEEAYQDGLHWLSQGNQPAARQCTALALIGLGQEAEGAARLEDLANGKNAGSLAQRGIYLAQAGNAWLLAKQPDAAVLTLTNAMKLMPKDSALKKDRARAFLMLEKWKEAEADLDAAIEMSPGDGEALEMRARANLKQGEFDAAWSDVKAALKAMPTDVSTAVLRGDIREAMRKAGKSDPALKEEPSEIRPRIVGQ
jgi:regulator of sirC expression with transglutaminase-like and TPR domain